MAVFWAVPPCSLIEIYRRFRSPCCLDHQSSSASILSNEQQGAPFSGVKRPEPEADHTSTFRARVRMYRLYDCKAWCSRNNFSKITCVYGCLLRHCRRVNNSRKLSGQLASRNRRTSLFGFFEMPIA
ncbi:hypothetical protein L798_03994 [Zootermopsis nevadensis]|uniref:Uncharacterized protein n=1 Tax=Zootermopsis nevadensis TaxID=136037 RepID=A0A067RLJ9_ZOONE|nr:hypothetical protein L798_03994 [Zootermopsis nevadensis]